MNGADEAEDAAASVPTVAAARSGGERRPGLRAAGLAAARVAAPILVRHGGGVVSRLKANWAEIVGAELADSIWPATLGRDGALKLIVASAKAIEVQHRAPFVIERINLFLGRSAVSRLALVQGTLPLPVKTRRRPARAVAAGEAAELDRRLGEIADPELRDALARLGRAVIATAEG
jgi:hypothetical protein